MRMKIPVVLLLAAAAVTSVSAHIMVSPLQSKSGATQKYEVRVHNEAKIAATSVDLEIPDGVTVTEVAKPAAGTFTTKTTGGRITAITWTVDVLPSKYQALPFTAKNPDSGTELHWSLREHLADGSVVDWSDKPRAKEKGSVTKLASDAPAAAAAEQTWTGAVSDKMCGADHTKMGRTLSDRECTLTCAKGGAPYVLVSDGKAYQLTNHDADLRTHAGHTVNLTGELKGDTIRVSTIDMPKR